MRVEKRGSTTLVSEEGVKMILEEVLLAYRDNTYLLSQLTQVGLDVDSLDSSVMLEVAVDPGPRCRLSSVSLKGNRVLREEIFARLTGLMVGAPLSERVLDGGMEKIVEWYRNHGYPYAEVMVENFYIDGDGGVTLSLICREDKRVRIGEIVVEGNHVTRKDVVVRQLGIRPGDSFSMAEIERGKERLEVSGLYAEVEDIALVKNDHPYKVDLKIVVAEGRPNRFSGVAGLVPGIGGRASPTGQLHLVLGNLWGAARRMEIQWMGRGEGNSQLDLQYREPWVGGSPLSGEFRFTQEVRDTVFSRVEFALAGVGPVGKGVDGKLGLEHQSVTSTLGEKTGDGTNRRLSLLVGVKRPLSRFDSAARPWGTDIEFLLGRRTVGGERIGELEGRGWYNTVLWRGRRKDLMVTVGGRFIESSLRPIPSYHRFSMGGSETVRGYAEDRLWGNRAAWERTELGFHVLDDVRYLFFYDLGIVDVADDGRSGSVLQGFGAGVRLGSRIGTMRLDYAVRPELGPLEGRLHFGWEQGF